MKPALLDGDVASESDCAIVNVEFTESTNIGESAVDDIVS